MNRLSKYIKYGVLSSTLKRSPGDFDVAWQITDAELDTEYFSRKVKITGVGTDAVITSTGYYSINGAAYQTGASTISDNDTLRAKLTSSVDYSTETTVVVVVDGIDCTMSITTQVDPATLSDVTFGGDSVTFDGDPAVTW